MLGTSSKYLRVWRGRITYASVIVENLSNYLFVPVEDILHLANEKALLVRQGDLEEGIFLPYHISNLFNNTRVYFRGVGDLRNIIFHQPQHLFKLQCSHKGELLKAIFFSISIEHNILTHNGCG